MPGNFRAGPEKLRVDRKPGTIFQSSEEEIMSKLIYLTKCIIDLTVYPSLKMANMEIRRRV